jgi:hypothetical protein
MQTKQTLEVTISIRAAVHRKELERIVREIFGADARDTKYEEIEGKNSCAYIALAPTVKSGKVQRHIAHLRQTIYSDMSRIATATVHYESRIGKGVYRKIRYMGDLSRPYGT